MKVIFSHNLPFFLAHGGMQTLSESLMREIAGLGVEVETERWWDEKQKGDILHYIMRPPYAVNVSLAHEKGFKVIMTENLDQTASRTRLQLFLQRKNITNKELCEKFDDVMRKKTNNSMILKKTDRKKLLSKIKIPYAGQLAGTVTGSVNWAQSGTIQDLDTFVSRNYQNGVLVDEQITNQIEEHDWFAKGTENYSQDYLRDFSGDQKLRSFTFDPWAIAVGGVGGAIKGLIDMKKIHDKEDKNSRIQQYARRDLNTSPVKETATKQLTQKADTYKYVAQVEVATEPVEEKINNKKCRLRARHFAKGNYNMADSKKDMVATYYGIAQNDPNFNKIYEYIMEQINGLKKGQYNDLQYVNNMTYFLPEKLPSSLTGLDKDYELKFDPEKDPQELDDVKIELGGSYTITGRNNTQTMTKPGENAAGSITAQRRKREV